METALQLSSQLVRDRLDEMAQEPFWQNQAKCFALLEYQIRNGPPDVKGACEWAFHQKELAEGRVDAAAWDHGVRYGRMHIPPPAASSVDSKGYSRTGELRQTELHAEVPVGADERSFRAGIRAEWGRLHLYGHDATDKTWEKLRKLLGEYENKILHRSPEKRPGIVIRIEREQIVCRLRKSPIVVKTAKKAKIPPRQATTRYSVQTLPDSEIDRQTAIEEFFGDGVRERGGVIVLQSKSIEEQIAALVPKLIMNAAAMQGLPVPPELSMEQILTLVSDSIQPPTRFYKARTAIDKWDTEGAKAIRERFQTQNIKLHKFAISEEYSEDGTGEASFLIAMGLGYTDLTSMTIEDPYICRPWMRLSRESDAGDVLSFHKKLSPKKGFAKFSHDKDPTDGEFFRLLPLRWTPDYVKRWRQMTASPKKFPSVPDYGIILRHTQTEKGRRQIIFIVAGFTERGTAACGHFFAQHWPELWYSHVRGRTREGSLGDFAVLIAGGSKPDELPHWQEDPHFPAITPETLFRLMPNTRCEWTDRMKG